MLVAEPCRQFGCPGEGGRDDGYAQLSRQAVAGEPHLLAQLAGIPHDLTSPDQGTLAFRCQTAEPGASEKQLNTKLILKLLDACRECRLGDAEAFGRTAEMFFPGHGEKHLQLFDHDKGSEPVISG